MPARQYGRKIGPTGRKRDDFNVFAEGYKHRGYQRAKLVKAYRGSEALNAYGQSGVREAKRAVHREHPHKWVKFSVHNESRLMRKVAKRRKKA